VKSFLLKSVVEAGSFISMVAGFFGLFMAVISGGSFYLSFEEELDYAIKLVLWFVFCLAVFHCYYAFKRALTMRNARKIDYWYLSIAAVGVLFFSISYSDQRVDYLGQFEKRKVESSAETGVVNLRRVVAQYLNIACNLSSPTSEAECDSAQDVFKSSRRPFTTELMEKFRLDFSKFYETERERGAGIQKRVNEFSRRALLDVMGRVQFSIDDAGERMRLNDATPVWQMPAKQGPDRYKILMGLGQVVLWPSILALALALRITKVTIEVKRWAQD